jgi:hypothetical protein
MMMNCASRGWLWGKMGKAGVFTILVTKAAILLSWNSTVRRGCPSNRIWLEREFRKNGFSGIRNGASLWWSMNQCCSKISGKKWKKRENSGKVHLSGNWSTVAKKLISEWFHFGFDLFIISIKHSYFAAQSFSPNGSRKNYFSPFWRKTMMHPSTWKEFKSQFSLLFHLQPRSMPTNTLMEIVMYLVFSTVILQAWSIHELTKRKSCVPGHWNPRESP